MEPSPAYTDAISDLYWNLPLNQLSRTFKTKDEYVRFAQKIKPYWEAAALRLGASKEEIALIKNKKTKNSVTPGKEDIVRRAIQHFFKYEDKYVLGDLFELLPLNVSQSIMGHIKPPPLLDILSTPLKPCISVPSEAKNSLKSDLPMGITSIPLKDHQQTIIGILEEQKIDFSSLLKAFRQIADSTEFDLIRELSYSDTPQQIIHRLILIEAFTLDRLATCLLAQQADKALQKVHNVVLGGNQSPFAGYPLLSTLIPEEIAFAKEIKIIADKFELTTERFTLPADRNSLSIIETLLVEWQTAHPMISYNEVKQTLEALNSPAFLKQCQEVYLANYLKPLLEKSAEKTAQIAHSAEFIAELGECIICLENPRKVAFIPCGHINSCLECFKKLKNCPTCQAQISNVIKVYLS